MGHASSHAPQAPRQPLVIRFATAVGLVTLAALGAVAPATARLAAVAPRATVALWAALACIALGPMMATVLALRVSDPSVREVLRSHAVFRILVAVLSFLVLLAALTLVGSVLRATTHNHVLAGVTFSAAALGIATFVMLSALRLVTLLEARSRWMRWLWIVVLNLMALAAQAWIISRIVRGPVGDEASWGAAASLIDVPLFAICAIVASQRSVAELPGLSLLALVGLPLAVAVVTIGSPMLNERWVRSVLGERAPAYASMLALATTLQATPCARGTCQ